jgi:hypothetical protein
MPSPTPKPPTPHPSVTVTQTPAPPDTPTAAVKPKNTSPPSGHTLPDQRSIGRLIKTARSLADKKEYRKALRIIDDILIVSPEHATALLMKREFEDIMERSRNMMQVARQVAREGQKSEADKIVERVLEMDPFNPEAIDWKQRGGYEESDLSVLNIRTRPRSFKSGQSVSVLVSVASKTPVRQASLYFRNIRGEWEKLSIFQQEKSVSEGHHLLIFTVPARGVSSIGLTVYVKIRDKNGKYIYKGRPEDPVFFFAGR